MLLTGFQGKRASLQSEPAQPWTGHVLPLAQVTAQWNLMAAKKEPGAKPAGELLS